MFLYEILLDFDFHLSQFEDYHLLSSLILTFLPYILILLRSILFLG